MKIESGKFYKCGLGDIHGPMCERTSGVWLDQHGALYHENGRQWSHAPDSKGNLETETDISEENMQLREELDGFAKMYALQGEEKDQAQRWLKEREQMLAARDRDCELAFSILRGAISALHSMSDPIQANARQQIQMAIDALNVGATYGDKQ